MRAAAPAGLNVVGANDIESADFSGTEAQAEQWEQAYLAVDNTADAVGNLIYNGSADGCPTTPRRHPPDLRQRLDPGRLLPARPTASTRPASRRCRRSTTAAQPVQWANIDATGGGAIGFAGVAHRVRRLPDRHAAGLQRARPRRRRRRAGAALYKALATVVAHPSIPAATDLRRRTQ